MAKYVKFTVPLFVQASARKKFILNLNGFRNAHFRTLSAAKNKYHKIVMELAPKLNYKIEKCEITYEYYHGSNRRFDISNPCSIIDKFCCDALTDAGYWDDDNSSTVKSVRYVTKEVDKEDPRCEIIIKVLKSKPIKNGRKKRKP